MKIKPSILAIAVSGLVGLTSAPLAASGSLRTAVQQDVPTHQPILKQWIELALENDASRKQIYAQELSLRETAIANATLMDPKLKVGVGGLPVDSFKFDDDPMTNISVGLMQQFERGSTLDLKQKQTGQQADAMQLQRQTRELEVANSMTQLWLELGYQQQAERILRENLRLMKEMERYIATNYQLGKSDTQDLIQAQLQVSKLDEKLLANQQMQRRIQSQLSEWLGPAWLSNQARISASNTLDWPDLEAKLRQSDGNQHYALLNQHPMLKMADVAVATSQTQVELAEQAYTPQFGVEVMYAYRQANNMRGEPASDLVSAYLTLDIPLFTGNRQDRQHAAAQYQVGAAKSNKDLLLAQMNAKVNALLVDKNNLEQRLERYQDTLLQRAKERTRAVERGYQNNTAQFNDVLTATADELALDLEKQRLLTDLNIANSNLAYLLDAFGYQVNQPDLSSTASSAQERQQ